MKKFFYIIFIILFSQNILFAACTVTGGACSISSLGIINEKPEDLKNQFDIDKNKIERFIPLSTERAILNNTVCKISDCLNISTKKDKK